jgi:predicted transcriptional regulator
VHFFSGVQICNMKNTIPTPQEIEARAKALGVTSPALCKAAGIAPSTFNRWLRGETDPIKPFRKLVQTLDEMELTLENMGADDDSRD